MLADRNYRFKTHIHAHKTAEEVFDLYTTKSDDCWNWNGKLFPNGYGTFMIQRKYRLAHRVAYEWAHNITLNRNEVICHKCDNPKCVRTDHLFKGTQKDNIRDMVKKNRRHQNDGELCGTSKLKTEDVIEIRRLRYEEKLLLKDIAKIFNVSEKQISVVSRGIQWTQILI